MDNLQESYVSWSIEIAQNLYKDKAHFVYELLHNADNQGATHFSMRTKKPEQVEFDVMAESLDKKYLLVDECKWTTQENGKQLTGELLRKANFVTIYQELHHRSGAVS